MFIIDAHEDIAWNMLAFGRDYMGGSQAIREHEALTKLNAGQAMLGWPDWVKGQVVMIFATLFASKLGNMSTFNYGYKNINEAETLYQQQLAVYHQLTQTHPDKFCLVTQKSTLYELFKSWHTEPKIGLLLLMEGAEAIQHPKDLPWWYEQGVRIIGPAWQGTRYAGGTTQPGPFTPLGHELLQGMADLNMILDLSHLSDEGVATALEVYPGPIIASHSNPRALLPASPTPERHLTNEAILRLTQRNGVMGIVLANPFLDDSVTWSDSHRPVTIDRVVKHIDYCCQLIGDATHVAIGSDFDGGFGAELAPRGMESVADLIEIAEALTRYGYAEIDIEAIMGDNWLQFLLRHLS